MKESKRILVCTQLEINRRCNPILGPYTPRQTKKTNEINRTFTAQVFKMFLALQWHLTRLYLAHCVKKIKPAFSKYFRASEFK